MMLLQGLYVIFTWKGIERFENIHLLAVFWLQISVQLFIFNIISLDHFSLPKYTEATSCRYRHNETLLT